jgi:hypothetical protein
MYFVIYIPILPASLDMSVRPSLRKYQRGSHGRILVKFDTWEIC